MVGTQFIFVIWIDKLEIQGIQVMFNAMEKYTGEEDSQLCILNEVVWEDFTG